MASADPSHHSLQVTSGDDSAHLRGQGHRGPAPWGLCVHGDCLFLRGSAKVAQRDDAADLGGPQGVGSPYRVPTEGRVPKKRSDAGNNSASPQKRGFACGAP